MGICMVARQDDSESSLNSKRLKLNPQSYDLTRNRGRIQLNVRCPMSERIEESGIGPGATTTFTDLDNLPTAHEEVLKSPENPLD